MRNIFFLLLIPFLTTAQSGWQFLFEQPGLANFTQLNGTANYELKDGILVGTSKMGIPNSFLATKKEYSDFILEFEVLVDVDLNSGVQFRSLSNPNYQDGRVHGYQVEIETSPRRWAGGIYDESRRGWLYPLADNPQGQQAFRNGEWNHYRIEAIGHQLFTFVNGVQCANLVDAETATGFIAFQVHSIHDKSLEGKQVHWRNARIRTTNLEKNHSSADPQVRQISYLTNQLSEHEKRTGWRLLWNGKDAQGWRSVAYNDFPAKGWTINDGVLAVEKADGGKASNGGDIITKDVFSNFELVVDFKITEGANSGIKYFVDPDLNTTGGSAIGLEFQILDDQKHPDAQKGVNGNRTVGSLYDLIRAENLSEVNRTEKRFNGVGQWNRARITSANGKVEHWLNGVKVVEYNRCSQLFRAVVEKSKYAKWEGFGQSATGHILLQDHGDLVEFRNIKTREW